MADIERQISQIKARLVQAREHAGLTQEQAAKLVGMSRASSLSQHEGERSTPNLRLFLRLCDVYNVSPVWVLTGVNLDFDPYPIMEALQNVKSSAQTAMNWIHLFEETP
jgi:DNA-binding XRE family transcriptional regulator